MNENRSEESSRQSGQALTEILVTVGLIVILMSAMKIFSRMASTDEAQIAEARWLGFHCAYRAAYCDEPPEPHAAGSSTSGAVSQSQGGNSLVANNPPVSIDRQLKRSTFDAGTSLLSRYTPNAVTSRSAEDFASSFGINTRDDLFVAEVSATLQANREEFSVGLPPQITLAPRRLALLIGDGSISEGAVGEAETLARVKRSITLPGQTTLDTILSINEVVRELLRSLGLETVQSKWADRELKPLDRERLKISNSINDCIACTAAP
jgi:hypothetical protein